VRGDFRDRDVFALGEIDQRFVLKRDMKNINTTSQKSRRGFTLLELIVALILLGTVSTIVIPALGWMGVENRLSLQRQEAVQGLGNLMDELTSRPYADLTTDAAEKLELPEALRNQLPGAKLKVEIAETEPGVKRIRLELGWNQRSGRPIAPLRLTAWVHEREGR
jgi:prepilin-type N-terminal cleavage/methylation domain-containing protein